MTCLLLKCVTDTKLLMIYCMLWPTSTFQAGGSHFLVDLNQSKFQIKFDILLKVVSTSGTAIVLKGFFLNHCTQCKNFQTFPRNGFYSLINCPFCNLLIFIHIFKRVNKINLNLFWILANDIFCNFDYYYLF